MLETFLLENFAATNYTKYLVIKYEVAIWNLKVCFIVLQIK